MKPKLHLRESCELFQLDLEHLLDQRQELYKLSNRLPWDELEKSFECYYKDIAHPRLSARLRTRSNRLVRELKKYLRKLKAIAGRLLRDFKRKIDAGLGLEYADELGVMEPVLQQKRHDKNKVYSLHDSKVLCIAKGKAHKKYEFGRKALVTMLRDSGVIVSAVSFEENLYGGDTLAPALEQSGVMSGKTFESVLVDKGYRGRKKISQKLSAHQRGKQRKRFERRAAIEPVIGHLKSDYRMARCYLKGAAGAGVNLGLTAAAWNIKKWINELLFALILWPDSKRANFRARHLNQEYPSWTTA